MPLVTAAYNVVFEGYDRGLNALHISNDPAVNFGQVTETDSQAGTFYATDSGGKGYEDNLILMIAVNGTVPDDFSVRITSDGYTWTPNTERNRPPALRTVTYQPIALDETFTKSDFLYGPQIWKPTGNEGYPIYFGQDMTNTSNTFQLMFVDLNAGVLRPDATLVHSGATRINYTFHNLESFAAFNIYGYCKIHNNGDDSITWSNALVLPKAVNGYSVRGIVSPAVVALPGLTAPPTDGDHDGLYEDLNGNGDLDFNDVQLLFRQMDWITENEPIALFDFNHNGDIDFNDIQMHFRSM